MGLRRGGLLRVVGGVGGSVLIKGAVKGAVKGKAGLLRVVGGVGGNVLVDHLISDLDVGVGSGDPKEVLHRLYLLLAL